MRALLVVGAQELQEVQQIDVINSLLATNFFTTIVFALEANPLNSVTNTRNNPGSTLHTNCQILNVGQRQMVKQNEKGMGVSIDKRLIIKPSDFIICYQFDPLQDSFSVFGGKNNNTCLRDLLCDVGANEIYVVGSILERAVQFTLLDISVLMPHTKAILISDAVFSENETIGRQTMERVEANSAIDVLDSSSIITGNVSNEELVEFISPTQVSNRFSQPRFMFKKNLSKYRELITSLKNIALEFSNSASIEDGLIQRRFMQNFESISRINPLHLACTCGCTECIEVLLKSGAALNSRNKAGETAVLIATKQGRLDAVRLLIKAKAKVDIADKTGMTCLMVAVAKGDEAMVQFLIESGAALWKVSKVSNSTAIMLASALPPSLEACNRPLPCLLPTTHVVGMSKQFVCICGSAVQYDMERPKRSPGRFFSLADVEEKSNSGKSSIKRRWMLGKNRNAPAKSMLRGRRFSFSAALKLLQASERPQFDFECKKDEALYSSPAAAIFNSLLFAIGEEGSKKTDEAPMLIYNRRLKALKRKDRLGWNAVHFLVRSGLISYVNFSLLGSIAIDLPVCETTLTGQTCLRIASWNGSPLTIAELINSEGAIGGEKPPTESIWRRKLLEAEKVRWNEPTPLDLALSQWQTDMRKTNFKDSARLLAVAGFIANTQRGNCINDFFFASLLYGDRFVAEALLQHDSNEINIQKDILYVVTRLKHPNSCTFTFTGYNNPIKQPIFHCDICDADVCLVCVACHKHADKPSHELKPLLDNTARFCECPKNSCRALVSVDQREAEGYRYVPNPIDTNSVQIERNPDVEMLIEMLAQNAHEVWARDRKEQGWSYGAKRDDVNLHHPLLLPWEILKSQDKIWDIQAAEEALKVIQVLGFRISSSQETQVICERVKKKLWPPLTSKNIEELAVIYNPTPIDTEHALLSDELNSLVDLLGANQHESWAQSKVSAGWKYAPVRNDHNEKDSLKLSPLLVPFQFLTSAEQKMSLNGAREMVKVCSSLRFSIEATENVKTSAPKKVISSEEISSLHGLADRTQRFRQNILNSMLWYAANSKQDELVLKLLKGIDGFGAVVNSANSFGQSALYLAVKRGHLSTVQIIMEHGGSLELADDNGVTPLSISAFLGNRMMVQLLLEKGAKYTSVGNNGLSPLHYASLKGNYSVCELLCKKLTGMGKPGVDLKRLVFNDRRASLANPGSAVIKNRWTDVAHFFKTTFKNHSPLSLAVHSGQQRVCQLLVHSGADPTLSTSSRLSPADFSLLRHYYAAQHLEQLTANKQLTKNIVHLIWRFLSKFIVHSRLQSDQKKSKFHAVTNDTTVNEEISSRNKEDMIEEATALKHKWDTMLEAINSSEKVNHKRRVFAMKKFARQVVIFLVVLFSFTMFTSIAVDFEVRHCSKFRESLSANFEITTPASLSEWLLNVENQWLKDETISTPPGPLHRAHYFGPIRLQKFQRGTVNCDESVANGPDKCLGELSTIAEVLTIPSYNFADAKSSLQNESAFVSNTTGKLIVDATVYNSALGVMSNVQQSVEERLVGSFSTHLSIKAFKPFNGRFAPSFIFELVLVAFFGFQVFSLYSVIKFERRTAGKMWWIHGILMCALALVVIIYDYKIRSDISNLNLDFEERTYQNTRDIIEDYNFEQDVISLILLMMCVRFTKYLQILPVWGPMVMAVMRTCYDHVVILFMAFLLAAFICFGLGVTASSVSQQLDSFQSLPDTLFSLFKFAFTEQYDILDDADSQYLRLFFFILFVVAVLVLLNLFIGIITDVYPKAKEKSQGDWNNFITKYMQETLVRDMGDHSETKSSDISLDDIVKFSKSLLVGSNMKTLPQDGEITFKGDITNDETRIQTLLDELKRRQ